MGEIKDPIHGYIYISELEKKIIDSRPFQRLRRIKQLAGADLTYPGATHTRFEHSLGTMHLSGLIANHLKERGHLTEEDVEKIRVAGLLHDVGHGPFSHVFEDILDKYRHMTHEDLTRWIINGKELAEILSEGDLNPPEIAQLATGCLEDPGRSFLNQLVAGQFSPDIMDYLSRDSYFTGVEYGRIDIHRLIDTMDLVEGALAADYSGTLGLIETFIIARVVMFNVVYYHRTVRAANVMLSRAMDYAEESLGFCATKDVEEFLNLDDPTVLARLTSLGDGKGGRLRAARDLALRLRDRRLLKSAYELIVHRRDDFYANILNRSSIRTQIEEELGGGAGVDPFYVIIDVPTLRSIPSNPADRGSAEVPVYRKSEGGRVVQNVVTLSPIMSALTGFIDVIRVYTLPQHKDAVSKASDRLFGERPSSTRISM